MSDLPILANRDYVERINRAPDHVMRNLAEPLDLAKVAKVAKVACFSPFHFHRIFRLIVGETLHDCVKRLRVERAVHRLAHGGKASLTEIALECGFGSSSDFSRSFKKHFGVAPRAFDVDAHRYRQRDAMIAHLPEGHRLARLPKGANPDGFVARLRDLPERRLAYLRVFRPYQGRGVPETAARLVAWARARSVARISVG